MTSSVSVGVEDGAHWDSDPGARGGRGQMFIIEGKDLGAPLGHESQADSACNPPIIGQKPKGPCSSGL